MASLQRPIKRRREDQREGAIFGEEEVLSDWEPLVASDRERSSCASQLRHHRVRAELSACVGIRVWLLTGLLVVISKALY